MIELLIEGRASIVSSFTMFKFIVLYSIIQTISVTILYGISTDLGDWQYLYIDLFILTQVIIHMPRTGSLPELSNHVPLSNLTSIENLMSVVSQIFIQGIFQLSLLFILQSQEWYIPLKKKNNNKVYIHRLVVEPLSWLIVAYWRTHLRNLNFMVNLIKKASSLVIQQFIN